MERKAASGIMLTLLLTSMSTLAFNIQPIKAELATIVYVEPSTVRASSGTTFTINIIIANVKDLYTWQFYLNWSGPLLNVTKVEEGDFLRSVGPTFFVAKIFNEPNPVGACDYLYAACSRLGDVPGVNGSGTLATVTFLVEGVGESNLHLYETLLFQPAPHGEPPIVIEPPTNDGYVVANDRYVVAIGEVSVVSAVVDIHPDTFNLKSRSEWITAHIELPEGYDVTTIDTSWILLNGTVPVGSDAPMEIGDYDNDDAPDLMVKFNRAAVVDFLSKGENTITITGRIHEITFEGTDTIRVIGE